MHGAAGKALAWLVGLLLFAGAITYGFSQQAQTRCEACIVFEGRRECGAAHAADRQQALAAIQNNICGTIAGSMTRELACRREGLQEIACR